MSFRQMPTGKTIRRKNGTVIINDGMTVDEEANVTVGKNLLVDGEVLNGEGDAYFDPMFCKVTLADMGYVIIQTKEGINSASALYALLEKYGYKAEGRSYIVSYASDSSYGITGIFYHDGFYVILKDGTVKSAEVTQSTFYGRVI